MSVAKIYDPVKSDFQDVNSLISRHLVSEIPLVEKIGRYIVNSGGKRLRPLLVLLVSNALQASPSSLQHPSPSKHHTPSTPGSSSDQDGFGQKAKLATIIEFLHTATLLHDDVVDTSELRRGKQTANAKWGNAPSVLVGDFLYSRAFQLMVELGNMPMMEILSHATNVIAEGEVLQLMNCKNPDITEEQYLEVIRSKTAMLFQAASHSAAVLYQANRKDAEAMRNYGLYIGLAFQLIDDVLDYTGDAETMGKNVGDDLAEGKSTLPLIYTIHKGSEQDARLVRNAVRKGGLDDLDAIQTAVSRCGALDYTIQKARKLSEQAIGELHNLAESPYKEALITLAHMAADRSN
ncbi:MAG: octaprenyl diphosphate synthase [Proteobacteria bacterium]|nr:MAG: octaprenyl diphosphate synthase [Pseudomonadota bacterium]